MDRCHTYKGVHIPGCMGCAALGHEHCTCERLPKQSIESRYQEALSVISEMGTTEQTAAGEMLRRAVLIARNALD